MKVGIEHLCDDWCFSSSSSSFGVGGFGVIGVMFFFFDVGGFGVIGLLLV